MSAKKNQATPKAAFGFHAPLTSKQPARAGKRAQKARVYEFKKVSLFNNRKGLYCIPMSIKLQFFPHLYLGKSINVKKLDKIKRKLETTPLFAGVFVIALSHNDSDQLELYESKILQQKYYRYNPPYVIGIASDKTEAISLVEQIVTECLLNRGDCALKEYLQCLM